MCVCVCVCVCVIYFKELVQAVMKEVSPKSTRWIGKLEPQEELILQFKSKSHLLAEFLITWGSSVFSSMHAFNCLDEIYIHYRGQSALLKVHQLKHKSHLNTLSQKHDLGTVAQSS